MPIGTILAWHKSFAGVPALPYKFVECNGQILSDPESSLDGQVIPNLNGYESGANSPGLDGKYQMFLRGNTISGHSQMDKDNSIDKIKTHQENWGPWENDVPNLGWSSGVVITS